MPRRKVRLTRPKRRAPRKRRAVEHDDYGLPTDEEWISMTGYQSFVVADDESEGHAFRRGDIALILPHNIDPADAVGMDISEFWVAKIRDIRARWSDDVWVKVQWYYSPSDVAGVVKSFNKSVCGKYERIFSDHFDYVPVDSFSGSTTMTRLQCDGISQKYISKGSFYCRYDFEYLARRLDPIQSSFACPKCDEIYSPDDSDPNRIMHFCPRPSCRQFYHESCLDFIQGQRHSSRTLQLITTWPDTDEKLSLSELLSPKKRLGRFKPDRQTTNLVVDPDLIHSFLASLPDELVQVAEQPIVRGAAFTAGGVAGNISYVVQARRIIYEALRGSSVPDDWYTDIDVSKSVVNLKLGAKKRTIPALVCPECESFI